jgi:hypothetical protein
MLAVRPHSKGCKARSEQENAHPEAALLVAGDFNAGKLISTSMSHVQAEEGEKQN